MAGVTKNQQCKKHSHVIPRLVLRLYLSQLISVCLWVRQHISIQTHSPVRQYKSTQTHSPSDNSMEVGPVGPLLCRRCRRVTKCDVTLSHRIYNKLTMFARRLVNGGTDRILKLCSHGKLQSLDYLRIHETQRSGWCCTCRTYKVMWPWRTFLGLPSSYPIHMSSHSNPCKNRDTRIDFSYQCPVIKWVVDT